MLLKVSTASEISWKTTRVLNWRVRIKCWIRSCIKCWIQSRIGSLIIEDSCLEDDIIIVEDVDAEWPRCEEWESLDQSLCLEKNPGPLQKILKFLLWQSPNWFFSRWHLFFARPFRLIPTHHQKHINHLEKYQWLEYFD